jgi:Ca-activated chloride channel family protein
MFISKNNTQFIDYQDSYYCRQQRKKRRYKWLKISLLLLLIMLLVIVLAPFAQSNQLNFDKPIKHGNTFIHGPQLLFSHSGINTNKSSNKNNRSSMPAALPIDVDANIEINGLVAYAEIKQTFINPYAIALEGKYQFPLPENSAVKQLIIKIGDQEIIGKIMEKKAAKARYQKAKKQGRKASLVEQHRPNLFTNTIANIPAQSTVVVTLKFIMPVSFSNGKFNLRLPLAITDRYQPRSTSQLPEYAYQYPRNDSYKNAYKYSYKFLDNKLPEPFSLWATRSPSPNSHSVARNQSSINIALNSGIPITSIISNSHKIQSRAVNGEQNAYLITLNKAHVVSNKSFDLSWQLIASEQPQVSSFTQEISGEHYTLLTFFPPKAAEAQVIERDLIFIIDTSGSMQGRSMKQAKSSLHLALLQLNKKDSFNVIAFDSNTELLFPTTQMASSQNINNAQQFIEGLNADGGTEMYRPLSHALMMKRNKMQTKKAIRQIVFITDGAVANEFELMQLLNNAQDDFRLYTVGIGAAPNGYFMKKAAQFGRGSYIFIQNTHHIQQKITNFMAKISQTSISDIALTIDNKVHTNVEIYPNKIPDLYFGEPMQVAIKSQRPIMYMELSGQTVSAPWYQQLIIDENVSSKGISSLWARRKIEGLLDSLIVGANKDHVKSQVIATSLTHQIISPYTSFIAVEKTIKPSEDVHYLLEKKSLSASIKSKAAQKLVKSKTIPSKVIPQKDKSKFVQSHESLLVAIPQTSIGWQLQFMIGAILVLLSLCLVKMANFIRLVNIQLNRISCNEKSH